MTENNKLAEAHFNKLTPSQAERLALLAEECGELVQAIGKVLRHGYDSVNPTADTHDGNRADVARECGDVLAAVDLLTNAKDISESTVNHAREHKGIKVQRYLHHKELP